MAKANGSGGSSVPPEDDPDRTQRLPGHQEVVDKWFGDDDPQPTTEQGQAR